MRITFLITSILALAQTVRAAESEYPREVARWQVVSVPSGAGSRVVWFYAAKHSSNEWRVFADGDQICAQLTTEKSQNQGKRPTFTPEAGQFRRASAFSAVEDGWLVGFNKGEFGGALYWFSRDGKQNYKVSDHQVVDLFSLTNGLHAIEGLEHLSVSKGSLIRIARPQPEAHWQASVVAELPFAPCAVSVRSNGTMLIALSDSLVSVSKDYRINPVLDEALWGGLYPNSSILSRDERKIYIGMRQFVGEFDLSTRKFRLLVPSAAFLNKLSKDDEERIRKQHGG